MKFILSKVGYISLLTLLIAISPRLIAQAPASPDEGKPAAATVQNEDSLVDINTADALTLQQQLEGIGPKKSAAIVEYREKHGLFKSLSDLEQVYGIGKKTLARNQDKIKIVIPTATKETTSEASSPPADSTSAKGKSPTTTAPTKPTTTPTVAPTKDEKAHSAQ